MDFNSKFLDELDFIPSRSLGKKTFETASRQLQVAGILKSETDIDKFVETGYIELPGVPDGYIYDSEKGEYIEIIEPRA